MLTEQEKNAIIERRQIDAKADLKILKRDFYDDLPRQLIDCLDKIYWRWQRYDWFEEAWNKYRDYILECSSTNKVPKAPGFIFNDYIDEQVRSDFLNEEENYYVHSDQDLNELFHHGIKGQKWGMRRYQNLDGSLTEDGRQRYGVKSVSDIKPNSETEKLYKSDIAASTSAQKDILQAGKDTTAILAERMTPKKGSKRFNKKDYSKMSDEELRKKVNRLSLERQYGDLTDDNKYVMTGREKTREVLQTVGAILGIGVSAVTIASAIKTLKPLKP